MSHKMMRSQGVRKRLMAAAATSVLAVGVGIAVAPAAQAAPDFCPPAHACLWGDPNYRTSGLASAVIKFQNYIPNFGAWTYAGTGIQGANNATSVFNNGRTNTVRFYSGVNGSGISYTLGVNQGNPNLSSGALIAIYNDNLESGYF